MSGNTRMVPYGIWDEQSDLRAHVCVLARKVYVYATEKGREALRRLGDREPVPVTVNGLKTAEGYRLRPADIEGCTAVPIPLPWLAKLNFQPTDSTTERGEKAQKVVKGLLDVGRFPLLPVEVVEVTDLAEQISGADVKVSMRRPVVIQVKCDYKGGEGPLPIKGTLFLQTAECNPYRAV